MPETSPPPWTSPAITALWSGGKGGTFENLYYRTGCVTNVEEGGIAGEGHDAVTAKTEEEMKEAAFAASLNGDGSAFAADENGGYPVLAWQGQIDPSKAEEPGYHFRRRPSCPPGWRI